LYIYVPSIVIDNNRTNHLAEGVRTVKTNLSLFVLAAMLSLTACENGKQGAQQALPLVGEKAPDFTLPNDQGGETKLSDFIGKKSIVLYFYPKDDTPVCTREAYEFTQNYSKFDSLDAEILGVSVDGLISHKAFRKKYNIGFPLLSDSTKQVSKTYGVLNEKGYNNRTTFIINKQGIIKAVFENVKVDGHAEEVMSVLNDDKN
jgi:peroxiredoxin Q/BCP